MFPDYCSMVFNNYEAIRALFYDPENLQGTDNTEESFGAAEIGLIAMAVVILIGAAIAIFIIHRQYNG